MSAPPDAAPARPDVNQRVVLHLGAGTELSSRVEEHHGRREVLIARPFDGTVLRRLTPGQTLTIEWATGRGLARATGVVGEEVGVGIPTHAVTVGGVEVIQRRSHVRALMVVEIEGRRGAGTAARGCTLDLSGAGMRFTYEGARLRPGDPMAVVLRPPDAPPLPATGKVVRRADGNTYAMRFDEIDPGDRERLIRLVFASHRHELAVLPRSN
ncbi:MAG: PilZ domain [Miltoncostaeaceae bacterium]|nr:PilZ domain [Miltoncostaeaceae bacterium]